MDVSGLKGWAFPLMVIGANSITAYILADAHIFVDFIKSSFNTHLGREFFKNFGDYEILAQGAAVLIIFWLILFWMYRRRIFIRI
jgi:predicted acyltransferase